MNKKNFSLSIVTVSYNNAATIRQTIESVLSQTYTDFEYVIVDGASTDGTLEIIKEYSDKIRWISEPDRGLYFAMNKGWKLAQNEFVGYINADDFYNDSEVLESVANAIRKNPDTWATYGDLAYVQADAPENIVRYWKAGDYRRRSFLFGWMPPHPTFFLRRQGFEIFGGFKATKFTSAADYELMLRVLYKNRVIPIYVPKLLVRMRVGGVSNRSVLNRLRGNWEDFRAWWVNRRWPLLFFTFILKPLRKIPQYYTRPKDL